MAEFNVIVVSYDFELRTAVSEHLVERGLTVLEVGTCQEACATIFALEASALICVDCAPEREDAVMQLFADHPEAHFHRFIFLAERADPFAELPASTTRVVEKPVAFADLQRAFDQLSPLQ